MADGGRRPPALPNALTEGFQAAFLGGAVIAALGLVLTLVLIRSSDSRAHVELGLARPGDRGAAEAPERAAAASANASANASAAASTVRSIAASSWASETNQASNWEAGG